VREREREAIKKSCGGALVLFERALRRAFRERGILCHGWAKSFFLADQQDHGCGLDVGDGLVLSH